MAALGGALGRILQQLAGELNVTPEKLRSLILAGDEALTPNYLQTDGAGNVQALFPGGVILPSDGAGGFNSNAPAQNSISWTDTVNGTGALIAQLNADNVFGSPESYYKVQDSTFTNVALINLLISGANTRVEARALSGSSDNQRTIVRASGGSDFVQRSQGSSGTTVTVYGPFVVIVPALAPQTGTGFINIASNLSVPQGNTNNFLTGCAVNGFSGSNVLTFGHNNTGGISGFWQVSFFNAYGGAGTVSGPFSCFCVTYNNP